MPQNRRVPQIIIGVIGAVALLLFGAAGGMLLGDASSDESQQQAQQPTAVDVGFAQDMSLHHQQAVTMATLARERATTVEVRQLAFDIETNQRNQIGRMQGWLSLWDRPGHPDGPLMQWMKSGHDHGEHATTPMATGGALMPGMATSEEMSRLQATSGPEFDVYFLQLMLRHHRGGAPMAKSGAAHAGVPAVRALADNMLGSQGSEMKLMTTMLEQRGAKPLPMS
ncbi:DUF305 domain-containing protein [Saccharopolyspora griseoalba]|uniref:DUF305 domain-containing protein n=1 Tax=Saccharopolyspora griseoalba TaxID=1431848 RepID=A0ABW2LH64_9PSEU